MDIKIPINDYKPTTTIRTNVVQYICDVFLKGSEFHPNDGGTFGRRKTIYIETGPNQQTFMSFVGDDFVGVDKRCTKIRVYGCEIQQAIKLLIQHGWFVHRFQRYNSWVGYKVSKYPSIDGFQRVDTIETLDESFDI